MSRAWYAKRGDREIGPIDQLTLENWASVGRLRPSDHVRQQDETGWRPAAKAVSIQNQPAMADELSPSDNAPPATSFGAWYQRCWLSKLPWYGQAPLWLFYGFVWIPIWYIATATPAGGIRQRWVSLSLTGKAVACLPLLLVVLLIGVPSTAPRSDTDVPKIGDLASSPDVTSTPNRKDTGPNGEALLVGGDGVDSDNWYQYYVSSAGEEIKHGTYLRRDSSGGKVEADYDEGKLVRQVQWDADGQVVETIVRQADGTCLVESLGSTWKDVRVRLRTIENIDQTRRSLVKELDPILIIDGQEQVCSVPYANGFMEGVDDAGKRERQFKNAQENGITEHVELIRQAALELVVVYRRDADEQRRVGNRGLYHPDLLEGRADGVEYGNRVIGILP